MIVEKEDETIILPEGEAVKEGDTIVIHPTADGDWITHGNSRIAVGDNVVIVRLRDGDLAALNGEYNAWKDCEIIKKLRHDYSVQNAIPHEDTWYYRKYVFDLERPIQRLPTGRYPRINIRLDFDITHHEEGFQCWYPDGGVWIGYSTDGESYHWCGIGCNPYNVLCATPIYDCENGSVYCKENFLNSCGSLDDCCPPPAGMDEINYFQVHIRSSSSLYWPSFVKTRLIYLSLCEGQVKPGWCMALEDSELRDALTD